MRCDRCTKKIAADDENWQRFTVAKIEISLCEDCVKELFKFLKWEDE